MESIQNMYGVNKEFTTPRKPTTYAREQNTSSCAEEITFPDIAFTRLISVASWGEIVNFEFNAYRYIEYFLDPGPCEHGGVYPRALPWKFCPSVPTFGAPEGMDATVLGMLNTVRQTCFPTSTSPGRNGPGTVSMINTRD